MRDPEYLAELHVAVTRIIEENDDPLQLAAILEEHLSDIKSLLKPEPKSDASRKKVESGTIEIESEDYTVNKDFINATLTFSDLTDTDELISATYLQLGSQNSVRFDRGPLECAIYIYHTNKRILLEILRSVTSYASDESLHENIRSVLQQIYSELVLDGDHSLPAHLRTVMLSLRRQYQVAIDTERRQKLLGQAGSSIDQAFICTSLIEIHESCALIIGSGIKLRPDAMQVLLDIIADLKQEASWDTFVSHRVLCLFQGIQALARTNDLQVSLQDVDLEQLAKSFRDIVQAVGIRQTDEWKCLPICAVLQAYVAVELNGLCKEHEEIAAAFDYEQEILVMMEEAMNHDVFQHLITYDLFVRNDIEARSPFGLFFSATAFAHYKAGVYDVFSELLASYLADCNRLFVQAFIMHLADVLKSLRTRSEDAHLIQEIPDASPHEDEYHQEDLFYGVVRCAYSTGNDIGLCFWDDKDGDLHGFLKWASYAEVPSTIYSLFQMTSAIASGPKCSAGALELFDQIGQERMTTNGPSASVTLNFIVDALRYYARQLDRRQGSNNFNDPLEIDTHNALILEAYLSLFTSIFSTIADTTTITSLNTKYDLASVLFQLLACRLPSELYIAIFRVLATLALSVSVQKILWQLLEVWLLTIESETQITMLSATARRRQSEHRPATCLAMFITLKPECCSALIDFLTAMMRVSSDAQGALSFPENLGEISRFPGVSDYVDFVLDQLISSQSDDSSTLLFRLDITRASVQFVWNCLSDLNLDLIAVLQAGIPPKIVDASIASTSLRHYVSLHPGSYLLQKLRRPRNLGAFITIIINHDSTDEAIRLRMFPSVSLSMAVLKLALERSNIFDEFVSPMLSDNPLGDPGLCQSIDKNTDLLAHVCMLCSSTNLQCSLEATELLQKMIQNMSAGQSKLHYIALTSVDYSKTILLGFASLLDRWDPQNLELQLRILRIINLDLERAVTSFASTSIAHFMLGFSSAGQIGLLAGADAGEIGSGRSLLHSLLEISCVEASDVNHSQSADLAELRMLSGHVMQLLCGSDYTNTIVIPILRQAKYMSQQISQGKEFEYSSSESQKNIRTIEQFIDRRLIFFLQRKADMLRYCAKELLACNSTGSAALLESNLDIFVNSPGESVHFDFVLLDYLKVLQLDTSIPISTSTWTIFTPDLYSKFLTDSSAEGVKKLQLALDLQQTSMDSKQDSAHIQKEHDRLTQHLADVIERVMLRRALLEFFQCWTSMLIVLFDMLHLAKHPRISALGMECAQFLLNQLPELQGSSSFLADTLTEALAVCLTAATIDAVVQEDSLLHILKKLIVAIHNPASTHVQRQYLYFCGSTCLQAIKRESQQRKAKSQIASIYKSGIDRLLITNVQDISTADDISKISACVFLDLSIQACEDENNSWFIANLVRLNLVGRLMHQFMQSLESQAHKDVIGRQFDLLLRLSMARPGARELTHQTATLGDLAKRFFDFESDGYKVADALRLLSIYVSCGISLGVQSQSHFLSQFHREWHERLAAQSRRMQKASSPEAAEFQMMLDIIQRLVSA